MKDLVGAPHLITTVSWSETLVPCTPAQGTWLRHPYDGRIPHANVNIHINDSGYLCLFITLWWRACSLLQPDCNSYSCGAFPPSSCLPCFLDSGLHASLATATVTAFAAACLSCPVHVPTLWQSLTSPSQLACDSDGLGILKSVVSGKSGSRVTVAGHGPVDSEWIYACWLFDAYRWSGRGPSEVELGLGPWMGDWTRTSGVGYDNGSTIVVVGIPDCATADSTFLEGGAASDSNSPNSSGPPPSSTRTRDGRSSASAAEESHEAHGLGLIVKALVQQNASASLFLRTMVCLAALLCFAHSVLVLGERS